MRRFIVSLLFTVCAASGLFARQALPFTRGVNLAIWFESWAPGQRNFAWYDRSDFENLKRLGADMVRIPVHFEMFSSGTPEHKIDPALFECLDKAVDWAEELGLYVVIDNHSYNSGARPTPKVLEEHLVAVWEQIAPRYKDRSSLVVYEVLNEPNGINAAQWNKIQEKALSTIRKYDPNRLVVLTGADWSSVASLEKVKVPEDSRIAFTFHFYSPFYFTHQGADWSNEYMSLVKDMPFPYDKSRMPKVPSKIRGTWCEAEVSSKYAVNGTVAAVKKEIEAAKSFSEKNNVPVWCGEMGVYDVNAPEADRNLWYSTVAGFFSETGIPFTVWTYDGTFGIFKKGSDGIFPDDLNEAVAAGCGFIVPKKSAGRTAAGKSLPYVVYDDLPSRRCMFWTGAQKTDSMNTAGAFSGTRSIKAENIPQYSSVGFNFRHPEDFSAADLGKTVISLAVKFSSEKQQFVLRLMNPETPGQLPWRMDRTVRASDLKVGEWVHLEIPLSEMADSGAWVVAENKWVDGRGEFDWSKVSGLYFSSESGPLSGTVEFDEIQIRPLK